MKIPLKRIVIIVILLIVLIIIVYLVKRRIERTSTNVHEMFPVVESIELDQVHHRFDWFSSKSIDGQHYRSYNPSLFVHQDSLFIIYRVCNFTACPRNKNYPKPEATKTFSLIENEAGQLIRIKHPKAAPDGQTQGYEDLRSFVIGDKLYLIGNSASGPNGRRELNIMQLSINSLLESMAGGKDKISVTSIHKLWFKGMAERDQKNWMPFVHHDQIHLVYSINPHIVLAYEGDGQCKVVADSQHDRIPKSIRGGSQIIRVTKWNKLRGGQNNWTSEDLYLAFVHSRDRMMEYSTYVYAFETEAPYRVKYLSEGFVFGHNLKTIQFVAGLVRLKRDGQWYLGVSYGEMDCSANICWFKEESVLAALVKV